MSIFVTASEYIKVTIVNQFELNSVDAAHLKHRIKLIEGKIFCIKEKEKNKVIIILPIDK
jgi:hypothetical protein